MISSSDCSALMGSYLILARQLVVVSSVKIHVKDSRGGNHQINGIDGLVDDDLGAKRRIE